jgi:hypothetical protein
VRDLVIAVLALSLAAAVAVGGVGYLDAGVAGRIEAGAAATAGFRIYGGAAGPWFCFSGASAEARQHVLRKAADAFPAGQVTISGECAAPAADATERTAATYRPIGS